MKRNRPFIACPPVLVRKTLRDFNCGAIDAASACARLDVSRSWLCELRTDWLKNQSDNQPAASDGDHGEAWPIEVTEFLKGFLPLQIPPNFQLAADVMERLHHFRRVRSKVEDQVKKHLAHLIPQLTALLDNGRIYFAWRPNREPSNSVVTARSRFASPWIDVIGNNDMFRPGRHHRPDISVRPLIRLF